MKIAILGARGIPARYGGFETFAEELAAGLVERGHGVTVFCEQNDSPRPAEFRGVALRYCPSPPLGPLQTIFYDLNCLWSARTGYDVVYMLGYGAAPFCIIPRLWGTTVWINPDGLEWARAKWGFVARKYFRLMEWVSTRAANRIIADAEAIATSLASRHGTLRSCNVIPYGCEIIETPPPIHALNEWDLAPNQYYLVICRLEPENHVLEILQAFQQSRSRKQLIVLGNHLSQTGYVQQLAMVRDPRIRLIGTVYDRAKLACLRYYCCAYMHGHCVGGTNPSLLEAMGCGNLIFAHDNPFNRETLGSCGLFFANAAELTPMIDRAEQDTACLAELKSRVVSRARQKYSWGGIVSSYAALLENLPRRKPQSASKSLAKN